MVCVGQKAPDFTIQTDEGKTFTLSDYLGQRVVIYFYPKDDTPGCTTEACDFRESMTQFNQLNCKVIGISRDSVVSHIKFKDKYKLNFPLGSDEDGIICRLYGVWVEKSMFGKKYFGVNRSTFLINEKGEVAYIWPKVNVSTHVKDILSLLKS
jgi:peroxiredoxin Q/BCP